MSDYQHLAERYIAIWNTTGARQRRALVDELFTADVTYTDPLGAVSGRDGVDGFIAGAQAQFAGLEFSLPGTVDGHHDLARFTWHLVRPGAVEPLAIGFDVIESDGDRIRRVHGFLDRVPS
ncbi:nuclear transport factor 2 family protein [Amycolatopsis minnesotensis]|uniref:Nuclear transport factor 2 family protein n=1 Tax=Amycolatopsis minnesotensis TaxID=337894 RepID=A0ABP5DCE7_9PSEU